MRSSSKSGAIRIVELRPSLNPHDGWKDRSALAPFLGPHARRCGVERDVGAEALDEGHSLVGIETDLVGEAVAERPDDEISVAGVLETVRLRVLGQIAEA